MKISPIPSFVLACGLALSVAGVAQAAPYRFAFAGVIDDDPHGTGWTTFSGTFTYDSDWLDLDASAGIGNYQGNGVDYGIHVEVDGGAASWSLYGAPFMFAVLDDFVGVDEYIAHGDDGVQTSMTVTLTDFSQTAITGDALPSTLPGADGFDWPRFLLLDPEFGFGGRITWLGCQAGCADLAAPIQAVPTLGPFGLGLLGTGMALFGMARARGRRRPGRNP